MSRPTRLINLIFALLLSLSFFIGWVIYDKTRVPRAKIGFRLLKHFRFSHERELKEWKEKVLRRRVDYQIQTFRGESCIRARSRNAASALYYKTKIDINKFPILSWRWHVFEFPKKKLEESLTNAKEDDFGARIYVIFPSFFVGGMKALEYIWAESLPRGNVSSSPYSKNIKLIVLESGHNEKGGLIREERDLYQDYKMAFGEKPKGKISAVAIMTDSDSTGTSAEAVYDDIKLEYKEEIEK